MKTCISLSTKECLHLIPYLNLFDPKFIKEVGNRIQYNDNHCIFDSSNYISDYLLLKLDEVFVRFTEDDVQYYYNMCAKMIEIKFDDEILFKL